MSRVVEFLGDRKGATSIEYAMLGSLVSIVILTAVTGIGASLNKLFLGPLMSALK